MPLTLPLTVLLYIGIHSVLTTKGVASSLSAPDTEREPPLPTTGEKGKEGGEVLSAMAKLATLLWQLLQ